MQQFAQRFANDLSVIRNFGFQISIEYHHNRVRTYNIEFGSKTLQKAEPSLGLDLADFNKGWLLADMDETGVDENVSLPY